MLRAVVQAISPTAARVGYATLPVSGAAPFGLSSWSSIRRAMAQGLLTPLQASLAVKSAHSGQQIVAPRGPFKAVLVPRGSIATRFVYRIGPGGGYQPPLQLAGIVDAARMPRESPGG